MAVTFDANSTAPTIASAAVGVTGVTHANLTVGSGANRALVVQLSFSLESLGTVAVTWDSGGSNQAMTQIVAQKTTGTFGESQLWGLVAPTAGNKTLKVTWTGTSDLYINGTSWTGVDQTGGTTSFPNSQSIQGTTVAAGTNALPSPAPIVITSAVGNATMAVVSMDAGSLSLPTQTQTFLDNTLTQDGAASRAAGAATVSHNWSSDTSGDHFVIVGTDIAVPSAAGRGLFLNDQMNSGGCGGSFFRNPLTAPVGFVRRDRIFVPARMAA